MTRLARRASALVLFTATAALVTPPQPAHAQVATTQPDAATVARVYDVRDLIEGVRPYSAPRSLIPPTEISGAHDTGPGLFSGESAGSAPGAGQPGGGPGMSMMPQTAQLFGGSKLGQEPQPPTPAGDVIKLLEETVDPSSWRDNGGKVGSARELAGQLIVRQTEANQRAIGEILSQLRDTATQLVTVRAHWVALDAAQLDAMTKPVAEAKGTFLTADLTAINKLDPKTTLHFRAQITCLDRQTVRVGSGRARTVISDLTPVVAQDAAAYAPTAALVQAGATIELTPRLSPGHHTAVIDVASVVSDWDANQPLVPAPPVASSRPTNATPPAGVDRIQLLAQHLRTTVVVPVGQAVVVGGMTLDPTTTTGTSDHDNRQIYLILDVVGTQAK